MKRYLYLNAAVALSALIFSCNVTSRSEEEIAKKDFGEVAWENSAIPVRPGESATDSFWNKFSERFISNKSMELIPTGSKCYHWQIRSDGPFRTPPLLLH